MRTTERQLFAGYGHLSDRVARSHATEAVLLERIRELWSFRAWYRRQPNWSFWMDLAARNDVELRALVLVARKARRVEVIPDPIDEYQRWRDAGWTESDLREAFGR